jgi:hypothetical protein
VNTQAREIPELPGKWVVSRFGRYTWSKESEREEEKSDALPGICLTSTTTIDESD